ncbi:MAG TPA: DUF1801 domain-containing protein [Flavisolibacter sp.]|nr:DUF1801 domain-containing protein [Flavisolibacter sp.]
MAGAKSSVAEFMSKLNHPMKGAIAATRSLILAADKTITEHIKWNAPSFCMNGDDRITFNLRPSDHFLLIFHRGAKVKDAGSFVFEDGSGLLEWLSADRAVVKIYSEDELSSKKQALTQLVKKWMKETLG